MAICLVVALVLVAAAGISFLYSDNEAGVHQATDAGKSAVEAYPLLRAIPSDAALVAAFGDFSQAVALVSDSTKLFGTLIAGDKASPFGRFMDRLSRLDLGKMGGGDAVVSHHYSGSMVPLLVLESRDSLAVSRVYAAADSSGLPHKEGKLLDGTPIACFSESEALMLASKRHVENGVSVLDQGSFPEAAASGAGRSVLLFCHEYAYRLMRPFFVKPYLGHSSFIGGVAKWSALSVKSRSDATLQMSGLLVAPGNMASEFVNVFGKAAPGDSKAMEILPASTVFAVSIPTDDIAGYLDAYERDLDATEKSTKRQEAATRLSSGMGITPRKWAEALDIKEVVRADIAMGKGTSPIVMARIGKYNKDLLERGLSGRQEAGKPHGNRYGGFLGNLFGGLFSILDESTAMMRGDWLIAGPESVMREVYASDSVAFVSLSKAGVQPAGNDVNLLAYYSMSQNPSSFESIYTESMAESIRRTMIGCASEYAVLTVEGNAVSLKVERTDKSKTLPANVVKDTTVVIPQGPFAVHNCGTGRTNLFGQAPNGALTLSEEGGKAIWSVPFKGRLCGNVAEVDYYDNGKIQFLFASGSELHMMDRLGRKVSGFPVDVGKEIRLGPLAYDFLGNGAFRVIVVHKDNTVGMYNIHGKMLDGWKGIAPEETIKSLPELLDVDGAKYWVIRTSGMAQIYPLLGGEPLVKLSGDKAFRPDAQFSVEGDKVSGLCLDGKERNVKL